MRKLKNHRQEMERIFGFIEFGLSLFRNFLWPFEEFFVLKKHGHRHLLLLNDGELMLKRKADNGQPDHSLSLSVLSLLLR